MTTELMDLEEELPRRERRRLVTPVGVGAVAVLIAAAGFFGGVHVQKSRGDTGGGAGAAGRFAGARAGGFGGAGAPGGSAPGAQAGGGQAGGGQAGGGQAGGGQAGGGQAGGATVGQVSSVDGKTLYVADSSGTTLRVRLAKGGTVTRTAKADPTAIHPGDTVIVQGETASSGTVVASTIRATAKNAAGAGFGGFGGFGGGAAPGAQSAPGGG